MRVLVGCLSVGAVLACAEPTGSPDLDPLIGTGQAPTEPVQPRGSLDRSLVITADGRSENHSVLRGLYEGQAAGDLAMESVLYGRIVVGGSYFLVTPDSLVTHDLFYGPTNRSVQRDFSGWPRDSTHFAIQGDNMVLQYYSYPADAPVLTEQTYTRLR